MYVISPTLSYYCKQLVPFLWQSSWRHNWWCMPSWDSSLMRAVVSIRGKKPSTDSGDSTAHRSVHGWQAAAVGGAALFWGKQTGILQILSQQDDKARESYILHIYSLTIMACNVWMEIQLKLSRRELDKKTWFCRTDLKDEGTRALSGTSMTKSNSSMCWMDPCADPWFLPGA